MPLAWLESAGRPLPTKVRLVRLAQARRAASPNRVAVLRLMEERAHLAPRSPTTDPTGRTARPSIKR